MTVLTPEDWFERLNGMFVAPTRPQWQDRLVRPSTIRNPEGLGPAHISRYWTPRNRYLDTLWSYKVGDPPLPQIQPEYADVFRDVLRKARSNYAPMCIGAMLDRLELQAVSTLADSDADGDDMAADIMDETGFGAVLKDLFGFALSMGEGYGMVVPGVQGGATLSNGVPAPSIHAIDPRRCIGVPDLLNPVRLRAALVYQYDPVTWDYLAYMFLPGEKWTLRWDSGVKNWNLADTVPERVDGLDALGGIPIVRFDNLDGLGEYEPHLDLLDRINDTTLQRIIGFWYQALRQRAMFGDEDEGDQDEPDSEPVDWNKMLSAGPGAIWRFPADFKLQELQQADFSPIINAKRDDVKEFAAVTSTPLHLITPDAANGSAEGAGLMRESLTSKVRDRRARWSPSLKLLWRIAFAMAGAQDRGRGMRLHWGPIEFRTLAEKASASAQAQGTLSLEDRCEQIWEMSPDDTARNINRLSADQALGLPTAPNPAASPAPAAAVTDAGA
ncbi:phage portal protein [Mycolicibacterium brisbanense]